MGWLGDTLYLEVHGALKGQEDPELQSLTYLTRALVAATQDRSVELDWKNAEQVFLKASGVPEALSHAPSAIAKTEEPSRF
jgi:hypothetical protein